MTNTEGKQNIVYFCKKVGNENDLPEGTKRDYFTIKNATLFSPESVSVKILRLDLYRDGGNRKDNTDDNNKIYTYTLVDASSLGYEAAYSFLNKMGINYSDYKKGHMYYNLEGIVGKKVIGFFNEFKNNPQTFVGAIGIEGDYWKEQSNFPIEDFIDSPGGL